MCLGIVIETCLAAGCEGLHRRAGDLMIIKCKHMPVVIAGGQPICIAGRMHIDAHAHHNLTNPLYKRNIVHHCVSNVYV